MPLTVTAVHSGHAISCNTITPSTTAVRVVPRWYKDSIMGPSQKWIHERSFAEGLVTRWAESITDSEKIFPPK
jgi:hypothetical protein